MLTLKNLLATAAILSIAGTVSFADDAQTPAQQPQSSESATMPGCPGMGGKTGMGQMMGKGMHGMMNSMPMGMGMGMMQPGMMMAGTPEMVEARLAALKTDLAITDAQNDAWKGYADALKNRASTMQRLHASTAQAMQSGTMIDRLDAHIKHMTSMLEAMKALKPTAENLYRVLNDEQKKKADTLLGAGCGMM